MGYTLHTFCRQKFVKMWDTFCIQTFCKHFVYINSDVQHKHYEYNLYIKFIQNVNTNIFMLNGSLISIYFETFFVLS